MSSTFKAYDIRGRYPSELNESLARRIGWGLGVHLGAGPVVIGRDIRHSAPSISAAAIEGITAAGLDVMDLGVCTTPMLYFAVAATKARGGMMVTASHNPPQDIGMKLCREDAIPIGRDSGLTTIQELIQDAKPGTPSGRCTPHDILPDYRRHILGEVQPGRPILAAVDAAGGPAGPVFDAIFDDSTDLPIKFERLCFKPDPDFSCHEPDPLKDRNVEDLARAIRETKAEVGIAFDGDGDRCIFLDSAGRRIASDLITILLAQVALKKHPGAAIVYDLRSSRAVPEEIRRAGGVPVRERVGHAFIKHTMRRREAAFGGELSGHFYFREHAYADSGLMACARVLTLLGSGSETLEERVLPYRRYHATGEVNYEVVDKEKALERISSLYARHPQDRLDGITVSTDDWWFNVRPSNTEPLLRLNLEANSKERRDAVQRELRPILGDPV